MRWLGQTAAFPDGNIAGQAYTATTNATGQFFLKVPVPGTYNFVFIIPAYEPKTVDNVLIKLGQTTQLNFQLIPLPS